MKKEYIPQIRIISVDHDRTVAASQRLRHAMDAHGLKNYPVRNVFCHLESGRCGITSGRVAIEVDGQIIWQGSELTENLAEQFCAGFPVFVQKQKEALGIA